MLDRISEISSELKVIASKYNTAWLISDISTSLKLNGQKHQSEICKDLSSPFRQLLYFCSLNITSPPNDEELFQFQDISEIIKIKDLLNQIEIEYQKLFYNSPTDNPDSKWFINRQIAVPTFLAYFNTWEQNFEEQIIERIEQTFTKFNKEIEEKIGLTVEDLIGMYNFLDDLSLKKLNTKPKIFDPDNIENFFENILKKGITPDKWGEFMGDELEELDSFMKYPGQFDSFNRQELIDVFGVDKTSLFLNLFSVSRTENSDFLFYHNESIILSRPFIEIEEGKYHVFYLKIVLKAIWDLLFDIFKNDAKLYQKVLKKRDNELENKSLQIITDFFPKDAKIYFNYFVDGFENDILVLWRHKAYIFEIKAGNIRSPFYNPDKAYDRIKKDFDSTIDYAYEQCFRIKEKFINKDEFWILDGKGKKIDLIKTRSFHNAFSIVITLNKFGQIQSDLGILLDLYEDDVYPLSLCIDDLEVIFLTLKKLGINQNDFTKYLFQRTKCHEMKFLSGDELEYFSLFVKFGNLLKFNDGKSITNLTPDLPDFIDDLYRKGLGFKNEKRLYEKTSGKFILLN